ncbi:MAG: hypothetical protein M0Z49_11340, partial [Chloroflexi bacterium]|nr:hypothetical protein [Chloroflexota bacterium]
MSQSIEDVVARAREDEVRLVRFLYCDPSGVIRGKNVHVERLASRMRGGVGLTRAQNAVNMLEQLVYVEGMEPVGEVRIVPDPETYSVLPWVPRAAGLICDQLDHDFRDWGCDPRGFLRRVIGRAADGEIRIFASFENEFYLAEERDGVVVPWANGPAPRWPACGSSTSRSRSIPTSSCGPARRRRWPRPSSPSP